MSEAGVYSNQGGEYQIINGIEWMINIITDNKNVYDKIEIDSTSLENGTPIAVDDIVIYKKDRTKICCQYKKNAPQYKSWTVSTLNDELIKASQSFALTPTNEYRFYSRTSFADLEHIRNHAKIYSNNKEAFKNKLPAGLSKINQALENIFASSTFEFLKATHFEHTQDLHT